MEIKFSKNKKLNNILNEIYEEFKWNFDEDYKNETRRYMKMFPNEIDYNIAQYGNLLIYYTDIRDIYNTCGYKSINKMSDDKLWETYKRQVGYIARYIASEG